MIRYIMNKPPKQFLKCVTVFYSVFLLLDGCVEPFRPSITQEDVAFLIVDGLIGGADSAWVSLYRSVPLTGGKRSAPELGATVFIEDEHGNRHMLNENGNGVYFSGTLTLDLQKKYRLRIRTANEREYASEFMPIKVTPPISSVIYDPTEDGLKISVNTNDPSGQARFYKWKYVETWEYDATINSLYRKTNGNVVERKPEESIKKCWQSEWGRSILITSTNRLREDIVHEFNIITIPRNSVKLGIKYSILIQQQVLTQEGFNYWYNLSKTTENLGSIFDPLPSEVKGNIQCLTNPEERVIGFFSGSTIEQKRIFITTLPKGYVKYKYPVCNSYTIIANADLQKMESYEYLIAPNINEPVRPELLNYYDYYTAYPSCIDCRLLGGTTIKPDFW